MPEAKQFLHGSENDFLKDVLVTEEKIKNKLNKLKVDNAAGAYEMSPKLLKECQEEIFHPLTKILQKSLKEGVCQRIGKQSMLYQYRKWKQN